MNSEQFNVNQNNDDLKDKKGINPVVLTILVIVLLALFGTGGWMLGSKYADMEEKKNGNDTKDVVNKESDTEEIEESDVENTDNKKEDSKVEKEDKIDLPLTILDVRKIYASRIPIIEKNLEGVNAYQNKKVDVNSLDGNILRGFAFWNIDFKEGDISPFINEDGSLMCEEACSFDNLWGEGWYMFEPELMQESSKELYGQEIKNGDFDSSVGSGATYKDGKYHHSAGGGTNISIVYDRTLLSYEEKDGVLTIIDEVIKYVVEPNEDAETYNIKVYTDSNNSKLIENKNSKYDADDKGFKAFVNENFDKYKVKYKHTLKKDSNDNWYWVSTEPVK